MGFRDEDYKKTESIGLYNVMRRLWLCYREACNLEIFSEAGRGTEIVITFRFPVIFQWAVNTVRPA